MCEFRRSLISAMPKLKRRAVNLTNGGDAAEDLLQDTIERVLSRQALFEPGTSFDNWAMTIMRNVFIDGQRKAKRFVVCDPTDDVFADRPASAPQQVTIFLKETMAAIEQLPTSQRQAVELAAAEASNAEAAEAQGVSPVAARSALLRGRATLRAWAEAA